MTRKTPKPDQSIYFLDLQTSGSNPESSQIIEFALKHNSSSSIEHNYCQLLEGFELPAHISRITGIRESDTEGGITYDELYELISKIPKDSLLIIHFASFEIRFFEDLFQMYDDRFEYDVLCTYQIAKRLYPNIPSRGIKGLAGYLGFDHKSYKSAKDNVEATEFIWRKIHESLTQDGHKSINSIKKWILGTKPEKKTKTTYPLDDKIRLSLPKEPGIYMMLNKKEKILYVGKATNLHSRVNSYFRGQKNRNSFKMEMLAQVYNIKVEVTDSPLLASVVENEYIKKYDPYYNIAQKKGDRRLTRVAINKDKKKFLILPSKREAESFNHLYKSINKNIFISDLFHQAIEEDTYLEALSEFKKNFSISKTISKLSLTALGLAAYKSHCYKAKYEEHEEIDLDDEEDTEEIDEDTPLTKEDVYNLIGAKLMGLGKKYYKSRYMELLANSEIYYKDGTNDTQKKLAIRHGKLNANTKTKKTTWNIDTYDRIRVVLTELWRVHKAGSPVSITFLEPHKYTIYDINFLWRI